MSFGRFSKNLVRSVLRDQVKVDVTLSHVDLDADIAAVVSAQPDGTLRIAVNKVFHEALGSGKMQSCLARPRRTCLVRWVREVTPDAQE